MEELLKKLNVIIDNSQTDRLLIEIEPSMLIHIYCEFKDKRSILRLIRSNGVTNKNCFHIVKSSCKFKNAKPTIEILKFNKGVVKHKF